MKAVDGCDGLQPLDQCNLAAFTARHPTRSFYGQIGAAYLFSEPLAPAVVQALHGLGPSYDNAFQPQQEDSTSWPYVQDAEGSQSRAQAKN